MTSNLKTQRTTDEQREFARKGGIASGKVRREKAMLREAAGMLLAKKVLPGEMEDALEAMGIPKSQRTHAMAAVAAMVRKAAEGNPAAFGQLMKLTGEGVERVEHSGEINNPFAGLTTEELRRLAHE